MIAAYGPKQIHLYNVACTATPLLQGGVTKGDIIKMPLSRENVNAENQFKFSLNIDTRGIRWAKNMHARELEIDG